MNQDSIAQNDTTATQLLTPWSRVLPEKPTSSPLR